MLEMQAMILEMYNLRHKPKNMDVHPIPGLEDYATAGIAIERAMQHLNESIPNGQRERSMLALALLEHGVTAMGIWLRAAEHRSGKVSMKPRTP